MDLNSANFDAEYYVQELLRRKGLEDLVAVEQDMVNNVRRLDSEMQSLVYENYSKFLNATSTVRDMQSRLDGTHNEMRELAAGMKRITALSNPLTEKFAKNCETIKRLNEARDSVKRLEFLIKVPRILQECAERNEYAKAVDTYLTVLPKFEELARVQSIKGIASDAEQIVDKIKEKLYEALKGRLISSEETIEAVTLLKRLRAPEQELEHTLLTNWEAEINSELDNLSQNSSTTNVVAGRYQDIFEFVDVGCCHYLTNLSLMASTFLQLFAKQASRAQLVHLLERTMCRFEQIVDARFGAANEQNTATDCALFVKALDRIYRKISVLTRLSSGYNFSRLNAGLVQRNSKQQIAVCRRGILNFMGKTSADLFAQLNGPNSLLPAAPFSASQSGDAAAGRHFASFQSAAGGEIRHDDRRKELLRKSLEKLEHAFVHSVKGALAGLLMFTASDNIFSTIPHFQPIFGVEVHEQIIVGSLRDLLAKIGRQLVGAETEREEGDAPENKTSGRSTTELIVLATFLRNLHLKHWDYLEELCREQYKLNELAAEQHKQALTPANDLVAELKQMVDTLLKKYVEEESSELIQMAKRSIELFDWDGCAESPKQVRPLIKHLTQMVEEKNGNLCVFMDDGGLARQKERTPDSLRGGYSATMRRATSAASSVYNDAASVSSGGGIVERLWGDAETTTTDQEGGQQADTTAFPPVEFRRDVIMNAIVRLLLRALCECVRVVPKFSRQGLEQMQVDCAYVRQKLWYFVADEHMLNTHIEDIVTAAVNQCAQPKLLDPSVVRNICEES